MTVVTHLPNFTRSQALEEERSRLRAEAEASRAEADAQRALANRYVSRTRQREATGAVDLSTDFWALFQDLGRTMGIRTFPLCSDLEFSNNRRIVIEER